MQMDFAILTAIRDNPLRLVVPRNRALRAEPFYKE
jgi:hypothetical protein